MRKARCTATCGEAVAKAWHWLLSTARSCRAAKPRKLRLVETVSLGERRFVSLLEYEQQKFLIGGTGSSLTMLVASAQAPALHLSENEELPTHRFVGEKLLRTTDPDCKGGRR